MARLIPLTTFDSAVEGNAGFAPARLPASELELLNSIHGHDTGMRHKNCGGEIYYDWTVTYDYEGATIPSLRCAGCKKEILGDADASIPGFDETGVGDDSRS